MNVKELTVLILLCSTWSSSSSPSMLKESPERTLKLLYCRYSFRNFTRLDRAISSNEVMPQYDKSSSVSCRYPYCVNVILETSPSGFPRKLSHLKAWNSLNSNLFFLFAISDPFKRLKDKSRFTRFLKAVKALCSILCIKLCERFKWVTSVLFSIPTFLIALWDKSKTVIPCDMLFGYDVKFPNEQFRTSGLDSGVLHPWSVNVFPQKVTNTNTFRSCLTPYKDDFMVMFE